MIGLIPDPSITSDTFFSAFDALENNSENQIIINNTARGISGVGFTY